MKDDLFQEEELRASNDPKYYHLQEDLHVEVTTFAPPAEAYARLAYALAEIRKFLIPVSHYTDDVEYLQLRFSTFLGLFCIGNPWSVR